MGDVPDVSVIVPLYNRVQLVGETIRSVMQQTHANWQLIVVDDGSTDGGPEMVQGLAAGDSRITFRTRQGTPGAPTCRNEGMAAAAGEFLVFLDSDDLLHPECLRHRLSAYAEHPDCDFLVFAVQFFRERPGDQTGVWCIKSEDYLTRFFHGPCWQTTSPIWKASSIREIGGWKEGLLSWQDWELHVRALAHEPRFQVDCSVVDAYIRRSRVERVSMHSGTAPEHLNNRRETVVAIVELLRERDLFSQPRRLGAVQQFMRLAMLQTAQGDRQGLEATLRTLTAEELIEPSELPTLRRYLRFEVNRILRLPGLRQTVRPMLKRYFGTLIPDYLLTSSGIQVRGPKGTPLARTPVRPGFRNNDPDDHKKTGR